MIVRAAVEVVAILAIAGVAVLSIPVPRHKPEVPASEALHPPPPPPVIVHEVPEEMTAAEIEEGLADIEQRVKKIVVRVNRLAAQAKGAKEK